MTRAIDGIGCAQIGKFRAIAHLEINDFQPGLARCWKHFCRRSNNVLRTGNIDASALEHPALGSEIILHVDNNDRASSWIDRDGFWFCIERDHSGLRLRRWSCLQLSAQLDDEKCDDKQFEYQALHDVIMLRFLVALLRG